MKTKKTTLLALATFAIIAAFFACRKDNPLQAGKKDLLQNGLRVSDCSTDGISLECGDVPHYATAEIFKSTLICLEQQYDAYNDSIQNHYSTQSDDAFNDSLEALGVNDELPLMLFERTIGYESLRSALKASEDMWLDNPTLVAADDPIDNCPIGDDPVMCALFNLNGEAMIGDTIYKYMADGNLLAIVNGECSTLDSIRNGLITEDNNRSVRLLTYNIDTLDCQTNKKDGDKDDYAPGRKYKWKMAIHTTPFGSTAKASTRSFKQKNNGHWKRYRTHVAAEVYGTIWNNICSENDTIDAVKTKRRTKVIARKFRVLTIFKTESGRLHSAHECSSTSVYSMHDLIW